LAIAKRVQTDVRALATSVSHQQQPAFYDQIDGELVFKGTPQAATSPIQPPSAALAAPASTAIKAQDQVTSSTREYVVQLSSQKSESEAQDALRNLSTVPRAPIAIGTTLPQ
jgi:hypothetical protein